MVANKALIISKEIDVARCKGNWQALVELARRYKKHNPNGLGTLEQSILAEARLSNVLEANGQDSRKLFANDSPNNISLTTRVAPALMKPIQQQLSVALGDKEPSAETQLVKRMTRIILAQTWFECGEYRAALQAIDEADYQSAEASSGYCHVLYMQALAIKAMSLDLLQQQNAREAYDVLSSKVNQYTDAIDPVMADWAEQGLYRGTLLALNESCQTNKPHQAMNRIRAYQKVCSAQPNSWRIHKRIVVTRYSSKHLSGLYKADQYQPPVDFSETEEGKQCSEAYDHQLFSIEILQLHTIYEKLVYSLVHFPRSGQMNTLVIDFVDSLAEDFEMVGGSETEKRGYVEALNRASMKTFNSPCITRHLFHALVKLGDYEQAEHALRTYLYLVGLESKALVESRAATAALASDSFGYNTSVPGTDKVDELAVAEKLKKSDGPQRSEQVETFDSKIKLLVTAVEMYCRELGKGADAVNMAEMAEQLYSKEMAANNQHDAHFIETGALIYRIQGAAFGFLASQTFDQDRRPKYHERALASLRTSIAIDNKSWQTYYQLGLQLAEMRDIVQAMQMVTQSLQCNSQHLPSWHLLALLCTCPIKESQAQALKTCDIALTEANKITAKDSWVDYSDNIRQHVLLQMTQTLLVERVHGEEAALGAQEALFQLFGKIVVPELIPDSTSSSMLHEAISNGNARYGMVLSGSLGNMSVSEGSSGALAVKDNSTTSHKRSASNPSVQPRGLGGRSGSVSSFTGRKFHLAEMFSSSHLLEKTADVSSSRSVPPPAAAAHKHGSKLSLLDPKSLIRKQRKEDVAGNTMSTTMVDETSASSIHSMSHSIISVNTLLETNAKPIRPTTHARLQHQRSCKLLCDLWLLSAEAFLRSGKLDEALKAVSEAESVDWTTHAGVWCLLGRIRLAQNMPDQAISAFQKGLVTKPNDVNCRVWLVKSYIQQGHLEVAEGLLQAVTQENGWDHAAAWYYLAEIYNKTNRLDKTKHCLFYALELESTTPIQSFMILPRLV
ncbi:hypothetical protein [Parasitella parasitica]|uniref:Uncharacterized protein n=1 Tax=Parasitella parasitica TaxID=35722 RepID=A0A0B7N8D5_9FUNG|nr:hypothetical protein [Parasitella parasitica]